ncbi:MAG: macrolide ABC transporter ATP-binding protein [Candidatus Zixiibacteriota bacterium]|nr:MAG: macrolide ABC transporter ATP-binding protein [candidate division Zixibacteria bacterium]
MIEMKNVKKVYKTGDVEFSALKGIDLKLKKGEFTAIVGPSGSGKSTLMNILGCLDVPSDGDYYFEDRAVNGLTHNELADIRNKKIGFVFQAFNLLPYATAYENVEVPLLFAGVKAKNRKNRVTELLSRVGLADKFDNKPTEMSGGEMQRVAIARALANEPDLILADEPTGNLDSKSGEEIVKMLFELRDSGKTIIVITHDLSIAKQTERVIKLKDGLIESNGNKL